MGALHSNGASWCRKTMGKPTNKLVPFISLCLILGLASCGRTQQATKPEAPGETTAKNTEVAPVPTDTASTDVAPTPTEPTGEGPSGEGPSGEGPTGGGPSPSTTPTSSQAPANNSTSAPRPAPVALAKKDCGQLATQLDMNQCAAENYGISDQELNQVYQTMIQGLDGDKKSQLTTAEERWIAFRDAECKFQANRFEGGSIVPLIQASCMEQITDNRIAELRQTTQPEGSYGDADAQLNQVYEAVQALASEGQGESLLDVQLTWLSYRDAHCEFEATRSADEQACLAAVTETRVWQLEALEDEWSL